MDRLERIDDRTALEAAPRQAFYGGAWHEAAAGGLRQLQNPGTGEGIGHVAHTDAADVDAAVAAARSAFPAWRDTLPLERARILRAIAGIVRSNARELAMLDAATCGNPVSTMIGDAEFAAMQLEFFAGLVTEMKGASIPMGPNALNFSVRQPMGVVARILAFNHPFMFCAGKIAAPLAAGNTIVIKPPEQAPLSSLRLAELTRELLPPGVLNILPGGREAGAALAAHGDVAKVAIIGSVAAGRAVMRAASDTVKPVLLELGGKNALIAFSDADPAKVADAIVAGMNFAWCGQSCGSTSRAFVHESLHAELLPLLLERVRAFSPGLPTDPATNMGAIVDRTQCDRIKAYIAAGLREGAKMLTGSEPLDVNLPDGGNYIRPTIFDDVVSSMQIAREEIFGPVLSLIRWSNEADMLRQANELDYGLTCSIWTRDLATAHRTALAVDAGYVWINEVAKHFLGAPFGGVKKSGIGREEGLDELLAFTHEKNIHVRLS